MSIEPVPKAETREERATRRAFLAFLFCALALWGGGTLWSEKAVSQYEANRRWLDARRAEPPELVPIETSVRFTAHRGKRVWAGARVLVEGKWRTPSCPGAQLYFDEQTVLESGKASFDREARIAYNRRTLREDVLWVDLWDLKTSPDTAALFRCEPASSPAGASPRSDTFRQPSAN